ncbi:hypothetical protein [Micromonospora fiedleri]|uniref:hypothetical protein n=1 Tax=Micromonospora fiedleri TaxID=1157498 RepID=UPI001EE210AB|nr:hypothetical protein [Micromonospora fiedleri]
MRFAGRLPATGPVLGGGGAELPAAGVAADDATVAGRPGAAAVVGTPVVGAGTLGAGPSDPDRDGAHPTARTSTTAATPADRRRAVVLTGCRLTRHHR